MLYTRKPEQFHALTVTQDLTSADVQAVYDEAGVYGTVTVTPAGSIRLIQTTANPEWAGAFNVGDLIRLMGDVFVRVEDADNYAPYTQIYVA